MRKLLLATVALAIVATGCPPGTMLSFPIGGGFGLSVPVGRSRPAAPARKCPPGHQESDGRCRETGKGQDPAKRAQQ